jgi:predicted DCC family thiol-disulfide oxidoreductase YuxK
VSARVYYDRDCGFCRWTLAWLLRLDRRRALRPVAIQDAEGMSLDSWHAVGEDGVCHSAGRAFAPVLAELPGGRVLAPLARRLEFALVPAYRWVATHRSGLSRLVPAGAKRRADALVATRTRHPVA